MALNRGVRACELLWHLPGDAVIQQNGIAAVWAPEDHSTAVCPALHSGTISELTNCKSK